MIYLLDTCVLSDFFKKHSATIKHFERVTPKEIYISTISVMEVEYGLKLNADRDKKIRPIWKALLKQIQILPFSDQCARATASIRASLKNVDQLIGPYDICIAGTAIAHHMVVVTSNMGEFKRVPAIIVEDWRESK